MGHLVRETLAYLSTTSAKYKSIDLVDGKSLYNIAIKRTKVDRHHQLLKGDYDQGSLWIPQPFQRAKLLGIILILFLKFCTLDGVILSVMNLCDSSDFCEFFVVFMNFRFIIT